jgi:anti-sigma factor RsiW
MDDPDHISCQEVVELVTAYLERALTADQTGVFEQHLNFCEGCVVHLEQMRATIGAVSRIAEADVPDEALDRLQAAFRGWHPR